MKTRIVFFTTILLAAAYNFSQDEIGLPKLTPEKGTWSIGYYASGNLGLSNGFVDNSVHPGFGGMIEISFKDSKSHIVLIAGQNKISGPVENHSEITEFTIGPRFTLWPDKTNIAELTAGTLMVRNVQKIIAIEFDDGNYPLYKTEHEMGIAASVSLGKVIKIDGSTSLIMKLRLISAYPVRDELFAFVSAGTGVIFSSKQIKGKTRKSSPLGLGFAFMLGKNNPNLLSKGEFDWGSNYGFEMSIRVYPKIELLLDYNSNTINGINLMNNYSESCINLGFGGRFFINKNRLTSFFEFGGGTYSHKLYASSRGVTGEVVDEKNIYPGFFLGTGFKLNLITYADLIARGNLHFLFTGKYDYAQNYLSFQGGMRFNL